MTLNVVDKCPVGFTGKYCDEQCPYPQYGIGCQQSCMCSKQRCNYFTGCPFTKTGTLLITTTTTKHTKNLQKSTKHYSKLSYL